MQEVIPNQIFVTGYSRQRIRDERDLKDMFKEFGVITSVVFKGPYSFITYQREGEAEKSIKELHEKVVHGNKLKIEIVDNRRTKKTGPTTDDECFKCKRKGHWAKDCVQQERSRSRSQRRVRRHSRSRSRNRRRKRSYTPSSRSASYSSSQSRRGARRRRSPSRSRERDRRRQRRSHSYQRRQRKRSTSSQKSKSASKSRSQHKLKSNQ